MNSVWVLIIIWETGGGIYHADDDDTIYNNTI